MKAGRSQVPVLTLELRSERDVVVARQRGRQIAAALGFSELDQARIATATSEMTRNAVRYGGGGRCEFFLDTDALTLRIRDQGPGIANLGEILAGLYQSSSGMGVGIVGTRRLMDRFELASAPGRGTTVEFSKHRPPGPESVSASRIVEALARTQPAGAEEEIRAADRELLRAISELRARNEQLEQIRGELEETNRGVVALYAELDEKAESLRKATELKSRFLSNMGHEFRTPLHSIQSLARILLDGSEGELAEGQRRAVAFIRQAAVDLGDMVNDLLDLAKIEAGKISIRAASFDVQTLFGSLRGVIKPLVHEGGPVALVFEEPDRGFPTLFHDEGKVQQILRNFASNALKFTERGEVRVGAREEPDGFVTLFVRDTGIGIPPGEHERIFEEFTQVDGPHQKNVKGTGLGLPLTRKLAHLLGGEVLLESEPGKGSTFSLRLPVRYQQAASAPVDRRAVVAAIDDEDTLLRWDRFLDGSSYRLVAARTIDEARAVVQREVPAALVVRTFLGSAPIRPFLAELKKSPGLSDVPLVGLAAAEHEARNLTAMAVDVIVHRIDERHELLDALARAVSAPLRVLVIAPGRELRDELRSQLAEPRLELLEARDAHEGVRRAREERPRAIVVDAGAPGFAAETARLLRDDPGTKGIPVLVRANRPLADEEAALLSSSGASVVGVEALLRDDAGRRLREAVWKAEEAHV